MKIGATRYKAPPSRIDRGSLNIGIFNLVPNRLIRFDWWHCAQQGNSGCTGVYHRGSFIWSDAFRTEWARIGARAS